MGCTWGKAKAERKSADTNIAVSHILKSKVTMHIDIDKEKTATVEEQAVFRRVIEEPDFYNIPGNEEVLIWSLKHTLVSEPNMLVKFLLSTQWKNNDYSVKAQQLMLEWAKGDEKQALPLLSGLFSCNPKYSALRVIPSINETQAGHFSQIRAFAVEIMKNNVTPDIFELILL